MTLPGGQPRPNVAALLEGLVPAPALAAVVRGVGAAPVAGLTDDSRAVQPGMVFVAIRGDAHDGHRFADAAVSAGAILVLAERALPDCAVPVLVVPELASRRSELAGRLWGHPSAALDLIAVTGTNGKTSVAHYSCQLLDHFGERCGYLGTIGWGPLDALRPARLTTADAMGMQERLAQLRQDGCTAVALEASSHALAQDRLRALTVDSAVFTNLSRDHLDYHGSMAAYAAAKARLFERAELQQLVLNGDDAFGQELLSRVAGTAGSAAPSLDCYGASRPAGPCDRYLGWESLELHATGIRGRWYGSWGTCAFELPLLGAFAVANVAAALLAVLRQHDDLARAVSHLAALQGVPGRMESFVRAGAPTVVVDYAHTPDALAHALQALRAHGAASLHLVFGCGGDRDRGKRPQMAAVAAAHADRLYLTSDNPRTEDPEQILDDMAAGLPADARPRRLSDRRAAIEAALSDARPGDLVLIAGKGHEDYQEIGTERIYFSDRDLVRTLLEEAA